MLNNHPCIAIDTAGGDNGPEALVSGSLKTARKKGVSLKLVGDKPEIKKILQKLKPSGVDIELVQADEVAEMTDKPSSILRRKKNTSIQVCCDLVKEGRADGLVSPGHTGVTLACSMFTLGRIRGIERPALATLLPREEKPFVIIDVGANVDSKPRHLVQFAIMADVLAKNVLGEANPKIGLLNIGKEKGKGTAQVSEAYDLLKSSSLNFIGNVEGRELFIGDIDIVVCDGFVGNVVLKLGEGMGLSFSRMLEQELKSSFLSRLGALLALPAFKRFMRRMDYEEYGGAPFLGLNGTVFVCHGTAGEKAIAKAVDMAATFISSEANKCIKNGLEENMEVSKLQKLKKILHHSPNKPEHSAEEEPKEH